MESIEVSSPTVTVHGAEAVRGFLYCTLAFSPQKLLKASVDISLPFIVFPSRLVMVLCKNKILETETTHEGYNFPNFFPPPGRMLLSLFFPPTVLKNYCWTTFGTNKLWQHKLSQAHKHFYVVEICLCVPYFSISVGLNVTQPVHVGYSMYYSIIYYAIILNHCTQDEWLKRNYT